MITEDEKRREVTQLLLALKEARGTTAKLVAASNLLAALDLIDDTPYSKCKWQNAM